MSDHLLERLGAESAIRRLIARYSDAVSRKDADAIGPLFTPDARVTIADGPVRIGTREIVDGLRRTISGFSFLHQKCDTGLIDVDGESARARIGIFEANRQLGADSLSLIFGTYEDEFRRFQGEWRYHRRRFTLTYRVVVPAAQIEHFADFRPAFQLAS